MRQRGLTFRAATGPLVVLATATMVLVGAVGASAVEPPPGPDALVAASNAMLQPADAAMTPSKDRPWDSGYFSPPGGQDPTLLCVDSRQRGVSLMRGTAVGYRSSTDINQELYAYPTAELAAQAWAAADAQIGKRCGGRYTEDGDTVVVTKGRVASPVNGPQGWWIRSTTAKGRGNSSYLTVLPVGNAVQLVYVYADTASVPAGKVAQLDELTRTLAVRYANASTLPVTQPQLLTDAQRSMMQPGDVPAALPVTAPSKGGWSSFIANQPGNGPWLCGNSALPGGLASFDMSYGGDGGVQSIPGAIQQGLEVYPDAASAAAGWQRLTKALRACSDRKPKPISQKRPVFNSLSGTAPVGFGGTPGVWSRQLDTQPAAGSRCTDSANHPVPCPSFSNGTYTLYLLVGRSVQYVSYYATVTGVHRVPIDQAAVNALALQLAQRWSSVTD